MVFKAFVVGALLAIVALLTMENSSYKAMIERERAVKYVEDQRDLCYAIRAMAWPRRGFSQAEVDDCFHNPARY